LGSLAFVSICLKIDTRKRLAFWAFSPFIQARVASLQRKEQFIINGITFLFFQNRCIIKVTSKDALLGNK
jgi:hypothetical protein